MDRQKVLDVLNSLKVIETQGGDMPYILVENNEHNIKLLNSVGINEDIIYKYNNKDDDCIDILGIALGEEYANHYVNGKLVWSKQIEKIMMFEDEIIKFISNKCEEYGINCDIDFDCEQCGVNESVIRIRYKEIHINE